MLGFQKELRKSESLSNRACWDVTERSILPPLSSINHASNMANYIIVGDFALLQL